MSEINNRYEFVLLFDIRDGNPNGDPDADNMPRVDPETGQGLVTDVCLKRKVRNYVQMVKGDAAPHAIYVKEKAILNEQNEQAYKALNLEMVKGKPKDENVNLARDWMCQNFFDVRTFGAVMSTGVNCGQVRGPIQMAFARSIDPVTTLSYTITRMAVTTEREAKEQSGGNRTMGRKHGIPYGLFRAEGFISANLARDTGFGEDDLELFWNALVEMFDHDHSASRGLMSARKLWIFKHDSHLGNAPAHKLFDLIHVQSQTDAPRAFGDYQIEVTHDGLPAGVQLIERL